VLDAFISYAQQDAKDAAALLNLLLRSHDVNSWFDFQQKNIGEAGMSRGVASSRCFLIFMTKSYFERVFTIFELETALALGKEVIVVWEADEDCGGFTDLKSYINACPEKYKSELFSNEAIKFERRMHLQDAQMRVITEKILGSANPESHKIYSCMRCDIL